MYNFNIKIDDTRKRGRRRDVQEQPTIPDERTISFASTDCRDSFVSKSTSLLECRGRLREQ